MNKTLTVGDEGYEEALAEVPFIKEGVPGFNRVKTFADSVTPLPPKLSLPEPPAESNHTVAATDNDMLLTELPAKRKKGDR